jgi:amino acid transporter
MSDKPVSLEQFGYKQELKRVLTMWDLVIYGLLFMVIIAPHSIFGYVNFESGGLAPLVYMVGFVAMIFTASCYVQMSRRFPIAGSVYSYVQHGLNPHVGFIAGWLIMLDYVFVPSLLYLFVGNWCHSLIPQIPIWVSILFFILVNTYINYRGVEFTAKVDFYFFIVEIGIVLVIVIGGLKFILGGGGAGALTSAPLYQADKVNFTFIATACSIAALNFLGFDGISTMAEETEKPEKNVGRAILIALFVIGFVFFLQTYIVCLMEPDFAKHPQATALFDACAVAIGDWFRIVLLVVNILAVGIANTLNAQQACSRLLYSMSRDRLLPTYLSKVHPKFFTPYLAVVSIGVLAAVCAAIFSDTQLTRLVNFGAITSFIMLNFSVFWFFFVREGRRSSPLDIWRYLFCPFLGMAILIYVFSGFDKLTHIIGFSWLLIGLAVGFIKSKGYKEVPEAFKKSMLAFDKPTKG